MSEDRETAIKLDGSMGLTERVIVTLITKDDVEGEREEGFVFPKALVSLQALNACVVLNLIKGYKIVNQDKPLSDGD